MLELVKAETWHKRLGGVSNAFRYAADYVLLDAEKDLSTPVLFSRNRTNVVALHDVDHGGDRGNGGGARWVREVLKANDAEFPDSRILLLAQPRIWGMRFSPVSFWLVVNRVGELIVVIAEVNNTFGERHSYICAHPDLKPISADDRMETKKVFHVSPFQPVAGDYRFNFELSEDAVFVRIDYRHERGGLIATLKGMRTELDNKDILGVLVRRPLGAFRVLALIHYQAARLWLKDAKFRSKPELPKQEVT